MLDLRPLRITENHAGMVAYAEAIFMVGQCVPVGVVINPKSHLPSHTAVISSLQNMVVSFQSNFVQEMQNSIFQLGGAVSIDGCTFRLYRS